MALQVATGESQESDGSYKRRFNDVEVNALSGRIPASSVSLSTLSPSPSPSPIPVDSHANAYDYLIGKGLNPIAVSGIIGNLTHESGLNPESLNPNDKGKPAYGLAQWRGERLEDLKNWATKNNRSLDLSGQLDYLLKEAGDRGDLKALENAKTPEEAALLFGKRFERPQESTANWAKRQQYARNAYRPQ